MSYKFEVGDVVTPTKNNAWIHSPDYLSYGSRYEVIAIDSTYVWITRDNGLKDGFPPTVDGKPMFVLASFIPESDFAEEDIAKAIEFIES